MADLPNWVWDVVADLIEEEDNHPKLYFTSGGFEGYQRYEWCPQEVLAKVPDDVRQGASLIRSYRRAEERAEGLAAWEQELLERQCQKPQDGSEVVES